MKHARSMLVEATSTAEARDGDTCKTFTAKPVLVYQTSESEVALKEMTKEIKVINASEEEVEVGDRMHAIQDIGGYWITLKPTSGGGGVIEYQITGSATRRTSGPYFGLRVAEVMIHGAPCDRTDLIGATVDVVDHSDELFDEDSMIGYTGWASEMVFLSLDPEAECDTLSPCHWAAVNRVCNPNTGIYAEPCPPEEE